MSHPADHQAQAVRDSFARQGLMRSFKAQIEEITPGQVILSMPITAEIAQQHGAAHAGASFALGDSASGYAALSLMPPGSEVMTVEMKINLLSPALGSRLIATGRVVRPGRRLTITTCQVEAETADGARKEVALLQGTMIPVPAA